jgi:hypothetical protein
MIHNFQIARDIKVEPSHIKVLEKPFARKVDWRLSGRSQAPYKVLNTSHEIIEA